MILVDRYKMYRQVNKKLNHKVIDACLERAVIMKAANLLGFVKGDALFFNSMDETDILMDFALNDYKVDGRNAIQIYREKYSGNEIELDILDALESSYTSLFEVTSVSRTGKLVFLDDVLNNRKGIKLIDIGLSETATQGILLFTRLLSFTNFNMSSGVTFAFPSNLDGYLIGNYKKLAEKVKSDNETIRRFVSFFWLSKTDGLKMKFKEKL